MLQLPLFSTSSKTSKTGCHQLSQTELLAVAPEWLLYWSWCGRIFPAPVRWRNYPQPGCHLVRYPPVVIIYQIHSDSGHYAETTIHTCSISLTEAWTGYSMFRTHLPECTPGNTSSPPESPIKSSSPTNLYMPLLLVLFRPSQLNVYSPFESSALLPAHSGNTLPFPL